MIAAVHGPRLLAASIRASRAPIDAVEAAESDPVQRQCRIPAQVAEQRGQVGVTGSSGLRVGDLGCCYLVDGFGADHAEPGPVMMTGYHLGAPPAPEGQSDGAVTKTLAQPLLKQHFATVLRQPYNVIWVA
jgi:hypothetical protein